MRMRSPSGRSAASNDRLSVRRSIAAGNVRQRAADVFGIGSFRQTFGDFLVANDGTQALQNRQVFVVAGGNADDEVSRLAFAVFPINAARHLQHGDGGFFDDSLDRKSVV